VSLTAFVNGRVYTLDPAQPRAEAMAVRDGRILAVGSNHEIRPLAESPKQVMDLEGRTVLPGFTDSHIHFLSTALNLDRVNLDGLDSKAKAVAAVAERVSQTPQGAWVLGYGWNHNLWDGRFPSKTDLDAVAPDHPVVLTRKDYHVLWLNSRALAAVGLSRETPDPPGGEIERDPASGEPTGIIKEEACRLVYRALPIPTAEERRKALRRAFSLAHQSGLTGIHEIIEERLFSYGFRDYVELAEEGELGLRVYLLLPRERLAEAMELGLQTGFGNEWVRIGPVKLFMDGTLGSRTADMLEPFDDAPARGSRGGPPWGTGERASASEEQPDNRGLSILPAEEIRELVARASEAGLACAVHAIGDAANRKVLDAIASYQATVKPGRRTHLRHRIEHAQLIHPADLPRFGQLGVIASVQPIHAPSDMLVAERYWGRRCATAYAYRSLLEAGARLAFGSDAPVESWDVLAGIHAAVTRQRPDGTPPGGWYPEQRLSVAQAVHGFTQGPAYASGEEALKGSITPGKLADLVILSHDLFTLPPEEILATRVVGTVVGGKVCYWQER